jgi:excisionase family DNA binding protein
MAGKFLSLEETARQLNVSVDEVHRLVDRKKLFPMRDGATFKFKVEEVERVARDLADEGSQSDALALDFDAPSAPPAAPAAQVDADDLAVGGALDDGDWVFAASGVHAGSQTIVRGGDAGAAAGAADASGLSFASDDAAEKPGAAKPASFMDDDLVLDSIAAGSAIAASPELSGFELKPPATGDAGVMTLDLGNAVGSGSGEIAGLSGISSPAQPANASAAGVALSGPLDSGLSLEDGDIQVSGIDLAAASGIGSAIGAGGSLAGGSLAAGSLAAGSIAGGSLAGEEFDLGDVGDEESASVVIATEETGDSSFFGAALEDSASVSLEESSVSDSMAGMSIGIPLEHVAETTFSVWQVLALVCCTLLMLTAGLVMFDLTSTIRAPTGTPLSAPLLNALSETLGWR